MPNGDPEAPTLQELPPIPRLAAAVTICYGFVLLLFGTFLLWIMATTGEPIILNPFEYGEAEFEAALLAVLTGVSCYGMVTLDYLFRA